jgi:H+/gluconate symporter-like permease
MAMPHEIQYINAYVSGSAAYRMDVKQQKKAASLPKAPRHAKAKVLPIFVDRTAILGILMAVIMLVVMAVGYVQLLDAKQEAVAMQNYVQQLQQENAVLKDTYASSYAPEEVAGSAQTMGMVPMEQVQTVKIEVSVPQLEEDPTAWQALCTFLAGLFA